MNHLPNHFPIGISGDNFVLNTYLLIMGEVQRSNCKRTTRKHLGMNKLLFGRERIRVFRLAGGEVLCCLWSISTTRQQSCKLISESTKKRLKFCKEIHITLYYQQKSHCLMKVMFLPKLCSQTCCLMIERDWLQMAPRLWHRESETLPANMMYLFWSYVQLISH
jgi:hypothetical protein